MARDAFAGSVVEARDAVRVRVTDHYERRGRELWGLARRLGASDDEAADVVQEAHLRLFRELASGTAIDDIDAWVFRVAYRLVMDQHRVGRRLRDLVGRLTDARPTSMVHRLDDALSLWPMVDRLPARERTTLYLRYRADLTFEQIGEVMGITTASARTYASRGTERLRVTLNEADRPDGGRDA
ncbi:MAG: sigma-70 family RNA polymerase sigma factor [Candidatus Limnocylindrales bacterium]